MHVRARLEQQILDILGAQNLFDFVSTCFPRKVKGSFVLPRAPVSFCEAVVTQDYRSNLTSQNRDLSHGPSQHKNANMKHYYTEKANSSWIGCFGEREGAQVDFISISLRLHFHFTFHFTLMSRLFPIVFPSMSLRHRFDFNFDFTSMPL